MQPLHLTIEGMTSTTSFNAAEIRKSRPANERSRRPFG